ncbi:FAD-binding oxidoreductase [Microcoleus sp. FACHB-1515]|uniref:NAD(P)/FAD-dependent oxidoreductase n=1 Tax=Cyanophyceae TaxID=3028117 RepID=UPI001685F069|nr:FAD-dependent oxidoreductase [Microcoleus sp. FACHB-1515]MBD2090568.1 FAD-binding oxidoreductase [Microcoleus sp. FACHB-1515]
MKTYDSIVVGGGLAGSAIAYELAQVGQSVLLIEQSAAPKNATHYSYGGIAYWSGSTPLLQALCRESQERYSQLSEELGSDIEFREVDLVLTIDSDRNPESIAANYARCQIPPCLIDRDTAVAIEPLLDRTAIAGALHARHGHVSPTAIVAAYQQAMQRLGGAIEYEQVLGFVRSGNCVTGVQTQDATYSAAQVVVAAGSATRHLVQSFAPVRVYFTIAELIETPPLELELRSIVMPAELKRFAMEAIAGAAETDSLWNQPDQEIAAPILDAGVVQMRDRSLRIGQISRTFSDLTMTIDRAQSELEMREAIATVLPSLKAVPGEWRTCTVAFSGDGLPIVGAVPGVENLIVFSGFSNPFALVPPVARRFARQQADDEVLAQLAIERFSSTVLKQ